MKLNDWTPEKVMDRWEALRAVKNLMGKYVNCMLLNRQGDVWNLLWSKTKPDVSLGLNHSYYVGPSDVQGYYQAIVEGNMKKAKLLQAALPE